MRKKILLMILIAGAGLLLFSGCANYGYNDHPTNYYDRYPYYAYPSYDYPYFGYPGGEFFEHHQYEGD